MSTKRIGTGQDNKTNKHKIKATFWVFSADNCFSFDFFPRESAFYIHGLPAIVYEKHLYLPQVQADVTEVVVFVEVLVLGVLGVVNLRVDPLALVSRVVNLLRLPLSLEMKRRTILKPVETLNSVDHASSQSLAFHHDVCSFLRSATSFFFCSYSLFHLLACVH